MSAGPGAKMLHMYEFTGTATVSVTCRVEAESAAQARSMVDTMDCAWECDDVDGEVMEIEYCGSDNPDEEE